MEEKKELLDYLNKVIDVESSKLVGKVCKRLEIFTPDSSLISSNLSSQNKNQLDNYIFSTLKKELKELIYESFRDLKDIFVSYGEGVETTYFKFINKGD